MSLMTSRCLPFVSFPNETVPVTSASIPASLGDRASNSSATRGRPPVMSRVFEVSIGIRASMSPGATSCPSFTRIMEPIWNVIVNGVSDPTGLISLPFASTSLSCGRTPLACEPTRRLASITTNVEMPVTSSVCLATVTPSWTFSNFTRPWNSVRIGREVASHSARIWPAFTTFPSSTNSLAPYGTLWRSRSRAPSEITTSADRAITILSPPAFFT